jgi:hypothetical protein
MAAMEGDEGGEAGPSESRGAAATGTLRLVVVVFVRMCELAGAMLKMMILPSALPVTTVLVRLESCN